MYVVFLDIYLPFFETFALADFDAFARPDGFALQIRVIRESVPNPCIRLSTSSFVWTDVFYLKLNLVFLKNILFYGEGYVETSLTLDVAGSCTLTESDAV